MNSCHICKTSFTRSNNLSRHLSIHAKTSFQCDLCSKSYTRKEKLKGHTLRHHGDQESVKKSWKCVYCSKVFFRSHNLKRHIRSCLTKPDVFNQYDKESVLLTMRTDNQWYQQQCELGKMVADLLHECDDISEWSLRNDFIQALKIYRHSQVQHVTVYENATLKPWQKKVMELVEKPSHREVIWIVGQKGGEGKSFLQNYIKFYHSDRRVIVTDIATNTKNIAHYLSTFPLECKDIFLFNHPCSTTESIAYDMLEGIKDGYKVSAKYNTKGLYFKTPNIVIVFSNVFPDSTSLKRDRWKVYDIKDDELFDVTHKMSQWKTYKSFTQ